MKDNQVKCPNCQEVFKVDDAVYNNIVNQVRDQQFQEELKTHLDSAEKDKKSAIELAEERLRNTLQKQIDDKENKIQELELKSKSASYSRSFQRKNRAINFSITGSAWQT